MHILSFLVGTMHFSCRIDFAQPSHVLQVAAAVAKLKGVTLQQVYNLEKKNCLLMFQQNVDKPIT